MLQPCNSSVNDFNLKFSSPSSGITLGSSFTPLKDLASSTEIKNDSNSDEAEQSTLFADKARRMEVPLGQLKSVSCSITEPKCSRSLFVDSKEMEHEMTEIVVKENDPTQKASENLIKALLEQRTMHIAKKGKSEPTSIRSRRKKPLGKPNVKITTKASTRASTKASVTSKKRKSEKIVTKNEKPVKKAQENLSQSTMDNETLDFGNLKMTSLKQYEIPSAISNIEKNIDTTYLPILKRLIEASVSNSEKYISAYAALLYLTETADSISLQKFDQKKIRLSYSQVGTTFQIKNSVSLF